ncbi:MAG: tRNA dihydrouridine synthase DusB [Candidatus Omnitrophica bacterium CG02_land_8_20_14_3_00__42_8]|nr:MAG: tRNA dihydrouridine synthase DusB [Candidatus Omnitrophica bacterium CG02_land_8_20_14_3_00__42_8]PIW67511.1 MAG: tRNA dihydrouridine synthase DusB [Candidatus Omnitrophica bacterium CG12_big_fil_rev_8_21_14_0_65_42_8]
MLKIGKLKLKSNLILAPMAGVSDLPFRLLNRRFGCELAFIEMINVRSLSYKMRKTKKMLSASPKDRPLGIQIIGCEEEFISRALDALDSYEYDVLDFNAACPVKKVARRGEGAALLKNPKKLNKLLKIIVKNSVKPVTVKIRTGWGKDSINAKDAALFSQDAGISALFIHGRNREQGYSGEVNYGVIKDVKKALDIPVIGSGDVFSPELAKKMLDETGCDGLLVARGALGNPWIFKEIKGFLKNEKIIKRPAQNEIADVILEHLDACIDFYGPIHGVKKFHKFFGWYTKGVQNVRALREKSFRVKTKDEMFEIIRAFRKLTNG